MYRRYVLSTSWYLLLLYHSTVGTVGTYRTWWHILLYRMVFGVVCAVVLYLVFTSVGTLVTGLLYVVFSAVLRADWAR